MCGCPGGIAERVWYGWSAKTSMIGFVRPLARYAAPMSRMNCVGEWVGLGESASSKPRGARLPP